MVQFILLLLGIFEVVCVLFTFLKLNLTALIIVYGMLCFLALGLFLRARTGHSFFVAHLKKEGLSVSVFMLVFFLLFLYQLFVVICYQHNDADDAWYVGTSVTTCETGRLFIYSPYTGELLKWANAKDYLLSPLPIFWAMFSKILHMHPTVFTHNIVPVGMLCTAYIVYYMLGKELLGVKGPGQENETTVKKDAIWCFLVFVSVLNLFGYYSTRTTGTFLLLRSWQGKAVYCAILLPLMFYYYLKVFKEPKRKWLVGLFLTSLAACMVSFSAVTLTPLLTGAMCLTYAIAKKDLKIPFQMAASVIPNVILLVIYVLM